MGLTQSRKRLWTPEGDVALNKDTVQINQLELVTLARMHEVAQKFGLTIVCKRCDVAITGKNADTDSSAVVSCHCREFRYTG